MQIVRGTLLGAFCIISFIVFGIALYRENDEPKGIGMFLIKGFLIYFSVFGIVSVCAELLLVKLHCFSIAWMFILTLVYGYVFIVKRKKIKGYLKSVGADFKENGKFYTGIGCIMLIEILCIVFRNNENQIGDNAYYIGQVTTNIYTDSIAVFNPYTGEKFEWLLVKNLFVCLMTHSSVVGQLFHIHALVEYNVTLRIVVTILVNAILYHIFVNVTKRKIDIVVGLVLSELVVLLSWGYGNASKVYFASRANSKMSIFPFVIVPLYYLFRMKIKEQQSDRKNWFWMFLITLTSVFLGSTSALLSGILIVLFAMADAIEGKSLKTVPWYFLSAAPSFFMIIFLFITRYLHIGRRYIP